jgi:hypothetical protein
MFWKIAYPACWFIAGGASMVIFLIGMGLSPC